MRKIVAVVVIFSILFLGGFFFQTKYYQKMTKKSDTEYVAENLWLKEISMFEKSVQLVDLLIASISGFVSVMLVLLVIILINRKRMENRAELKDFLLEEYQKLILAYLYRDVIDKKKFKKITRNLFSRQVLIDQIIDVGLLLPDDKKSKVRELYLELGLLKYTLRKLKSRKWHKKIKSFKELSSLNITDYNGVIMKTINSKNDILRMESQIALVKLSDDTEPFGFLSNLSYPFSVWEQITLHQLMVDNDMNVPNFGRWLDSPNPTVVMFCLRMIKEYEQVDNYDELQAIIGHDNERVRNLAIKVIGDLGLFILFRDLKKKFKYETPNNRLEIIKTMGKRPVKSVLNFLEIVVDSEDDVDLQIESVKAINNLGEEGEVRLKKMMNSEYKNYSIIIKHVLDNRIN